MMLQISKRVWSDGPKCDPCCVSSCSLSFPRTSQLQLLSLLEEEELVAMLYRRQGNSTLQDPTLELQAGEYLFLITTFYAFTCNKFYVFKNVLVRSLSLCLCVFCSCLLSFWGLSELAWERRSCCFVATVDKQQTSSSIVVCFCMIFILFLENTCNRAI
jgi:hypothetical protein